MIHYLISIFVSNTKPLNNIFIPIEDRTLKLKQYLNIPDYCIPFAVISIGYPLNEGKTTLRYDESKVHLDRY